MIRNLFKNRVITPGMRAFKKAALKVSSSALNADAKNIERALQRRALEDTASFVEDELSEVPSFVDGRALMDRAIELMANDREALILEFGVWIGRSINHIASQVNDPIHGFDSFEGLPEFWRDSFGKGAFAMDRLPSVPDHVTLHKGWFDDTLPGFIVKNERPVRLAHIDCDLYSSTKTVFDCLGDRLSNAVIVFDEFFNYPGWREGEYKAFMEFVGRHGLKFEYFGYCRYGEQVGVRMQGSVR